MRYAYPPCMMAVFYCFQLLSTLKRLPVTTKNQLEDNKIISVIQKWKQEAKQDSTSSNKATTRFTSVNKRMLFVCMLNKYLFLFGCSGCDSY